MAFPNSQRVIYGRCPLAEVVVQLKFQPILRIDSEAPARFQDAIRADYPRYSDATVNVTFNGPVPANLPPQIVNMMQGLAGARAGGATHKFMSADTKWEVVLTREILGLRTTHYSRWEVFRDRIARLREVFEAEYRPVGGYVRVGLKYVDVIRRSAINLDGVAWSELLTPAIAGELSAPELAPGIDSASRQSHCQLHGNEYLTLKTGTINSVDSPVAEQCFLIDADFHTHEPTENAHAIDTLNGFNQTSGRFFRWCIQQRLHDAMEPRPVG